MKLLLDEQIPRQLAAHFPDSIDVKTVQQMNWGGTKNGELLQLAADKGFNALITADKNIEYQQNPATLPLAVVVLMSCGNRLHDLVPYIPAAVERLIHDSEAKFHRIEI